MVAAGRDGPAPARAYARTGRGSPEIPPKFPEIDPGRTLQGRRRRSSTSPRAASTAPDGTVTELRRQSADVLRLLAARPATRSEVRDPRRGLGRHRRDRGQPGAVHRRIAAPSAAPATTAHRPPVGLPAGARRRARPPPPACRLPAPCSRSRCSRSAPAASATGRRRRASGGPVVAVLPFENLAGGERWDRLARGVTEEVIADLATNPWLFVLADATTRPHAGETPQAVGAALGVGPRRHRHHPGRRRARPHRRRARRRRQRAPGLGQAVGGAVGRPARAADRCGRGAGGRARRPLVRRHRPGRPRPRARGQHPEPRRLRPLPARDRAQAPHDAARLRARRGLPAPGRRDRPGLRQGLGRPVHRHGLHGEQHHGRTARSPSSTTGSATTPRARSRPTPTTLGAAPGRLGRRPWTATSRRPTAHPPRGRAGPERRGHPGGGGMDGPGARRDLRRRERLGGPGAGAEPGGSGLVPAGKGTAAFGAGDYEAAIEAFRAAPPGFAERPFFLAAAHAMLGDAEAARAAADELRAMLPGFDLELYVRPGRRPTSSSACATGPSKRGWASSWPETDPAAPGLPPRDACRSAQLLCRMRKSRAVARDSPPARRRRAGHIESPRPSWFLGPDLAQRTPQNGREPRGHEEDRGHHQAVQAR